jgi:two-component system chemotaxis response regulator CheB
MPRHDIIVVGASAGGVETMARLVSGLPADLPASVFVVHHFPAHSTSVLPKILERAGSLPAAHPQGDEAILPGRIYVAPPDFHLLVKRGHVSLARGPRENGHRPAVDPLFRTAARAYGPRVIGVILSGTLDDGTAGMQAIKQRGGIAIVQDPADATYSGMPESVIENVAVDYVLPLAEMAAALIRLVGDPVDEEWAGDAMSSDTEKEADIAELGLWSLEGEEHPGTPSSFACPECGGALWELSESELFRFRCRVGHAYSADTLLANQTDALEKALWTALRALEEKASLARRLVNRAERRGHSVTARRFEEQAQETQSRARLIRRVLLTSDTLQAPMSVEETLVGHGEERGGETPSELD